MREKAKKDLDRTERWNKSEEKGLWVATDFSKQHYNWMDMSREEEWAQVKLRKNSTRIQILRHFLTDAFLKEVFDFHGPERFMYKDHNSYSTINHGTFSLPLTILYLSVYVLISAHQVAFVECLLWKTSSLVGWTSSGAKFGIWILYWYGQDQPPWSDETLPRLLS